MSVDKATVMRIAHLARISIPEARQEPMAQEISAVLQWVEQLSEVDTDTIEPLASVTGHSLPMRDDIATDGEITDSVLANAPSRASGFFAVPKVVE